MERGIEVSVAPLDVALPRSCAGCCGPPDTRQLVPHVVPLLGSILSAPYCIRCARRPRGAVLSFAMLAVASVLAVVVGCGLGWAPLSGTLATLAAAGAGLLIGAAMLAISLRPRAAVEVRGKRGGRIVLACTNEAWARELATRSGGTVGSPARFALFPHGTSIGAAALVAPLVAFVAWRADHSRMFVDNASEDPIAVWVDGERVEVVGPSPLAADPTTVWVTRGWHEIGWSAPEAPSPAVTARKHTGDDILYNPGRTACYWRVVDVYSVDPSGAPTDDGPLRREELPEVGGVDNWFEPNPETIELRQHEHRATRTAIVRYDRCTQLVHDGCDDATVRDLIYCMEHVSTDEQAVACEAAALARCPLEQWR